MLKKKKIEITYYSTINSKRDYTNLIIKRDQILDVRGELILSSIERNEEY